MMHLSLFQNTFQKDHILLTVFISQLISKAIECATYATEKLS